MYSNGISRQLGSYNVNRNQFPITVRTIIISYAHKEPVDAASSVYSIQDQDNNAINNNKNNSVEGKMCVCVCMYYYACILSAHLNYG